MIVYKYFLKTALRQKGIILGYGIIFLILSIINSSDTSSMEVIFEEASLTIGILDHSRGELSQGLVEYLAGKNTIVEIEEDMDYIKEEIFLHEIDAAIIIPEDFQAKVENKEEAIEIYRDNRRMGPLQIENEINKFLIFANGTYDKGEFDLEKVQGVLEEEVEVQLLQGENISKNQGADTWFKNYFNFTSYVIIAIYVAVIGFIMSEFNSKLIQDRTKISSKKFFSFNGEIYLGQVSLGLIITSVFVLGSILLKGKYMGQVNFLKYVVNLYVFSFSILCFTFLINNLTQSRFVINGISTVASLGTAFISGVFVPQEYLGENVLSLARFFPTYYFVRINEIEVSSFSDIGYEIFMQVLFGIAFLSIGLYFSKVKQRS